MVVYTDREVSRTFANHFGQFIVDRTASRLRFNANAAGWWEANENMLATTGTTNMIGRTVSNISSGLPSSVSATEEGTGGDEGVNRERTSTGKKSISARVLGVSGTFVCDNGGTACDITATATYHNNDATMRTTTENRLATLILAPPDGGGNIYFQPSSANSTISLRGNLKVGDTTHTTLVDNQYMIFGWWQEIPRDADGTYQVAVFADPYPTATATTALGGFSGSAEYEGPAAGVYVEERFVTEEEFGGVRQAIVESGEFTATVNLSATFGGGVAGGIKGNVSSFNTDRGAKAWSVILNLANNGTGNAEIEQANIPSDASTRSGTWAYQFLARHGESLAENARADDQPIAAVGRFNARIENVRHIVGAFGAHRTTAPYLPLAQN